MYKKVKARIKELRISQKVVANDCGILESTLSNYLNGRNDLTGEKLIPLLIYLGMIDI